MIINLGETLDAVGNIAANLRQELLKEADRANSVFKKVEEKKLNILTKADAFTETLVSAINTLNLSVAKHKEFKAAIEEANFEIANYHSEHLKAMGVLTGDVTLPAKPKDEDKTSWVDLISQNKE